MWKEAWLPTRWHWFLCDLGRISLDRVEANLEVHIHSQSKEVMGSRSSDELENTRGSVPLGL